MEPVRGGCGEHSQMKVIRDGEAVVPNIEDQKRVVLPTDVDDQAPKPLEYDDSELDVRELEPLLVNLAPEDWEDAGHCEKP